MWKIQNLKILRASSVRLVNMKSVSMPLIVISNFFYFSLFFTAQNFLCVLNHKANFDVGFSTKVLSTSIRLRNICPLYIVQIYYPVCVVLHRASHSDQPFGLASRCALTLVLCPRYLSQQEGHKLRLWSSYCAITQIEFAWYKTHVAWWQRGSHDRGRRHCFPQRSIYTLICRWTSKTLLMRTHTSTLGISHMQSAQGHSQP